jgi:hypothetical protein
MEEPKADTDDGDNGDDPSRGIDEDPYGSDAEEQDPFGHSAAVQVGGSSCSAARGQETEGDGRIGPPVIPVNSASLLGQLGTDGAETSVEGAGVTAVDKWAALQERKRRKMSGSHEPIVEGEFARLARLAANEV